MRPLPSLISTVGTAIGKKPLERVTWQRRLRRHLGPILVANDKEPVTLQLGFDQISGPDGKVHYEIEATATGSSFPQCEHALHEFFSKAGINGQPLTDRHCQKVLAKDTLIAYPRPRLVRRRSC